MTVSTQPGRLPVVGHVLALRRDPIGFLESLRASGDVVRILIGPVPVFVVTSPGLARQVLVADSELFTRGAVFEKVRQVLGNGLTTATGDLHRRQRRLIQPVFHRKHIVKYAGLMAELAEAKADSWQPGQTIALDRELHDLTLTIVVRTLFASSTLSDRAATEMQRSLPIIMRAIVTRGLAPTDLMERLPTPGNRRWREARAAIWGVIDEVISSYRADGVDRDDLLSMLMAAREEGSDEGMSDQQLQDEVVTIIVSGVVTSATTLSWVFHELGRHPECERRLIAEVDEVLGGRRVRYEDLERLTYTERVMNEALRLYPAAWFSMRRTVVPTELGGVDLPAGTEVLLSSMLLHRDPDVFVEPLRFDPDRWLPERSREIQAGSFIPFGAGNRKCIGSAFASMELKIVIATMVSRLRLRPVDDTPVREVPWGILRPDKLTMRVQPRAFAGDSAPSEPAMSSAYDAG